jgi:hypothetical protein
VVEAVKKRPFLRAKWKSQLPRLPGMRTRREEGESDVAIDAQQPSLSESQETLAAGVPSRRCDRKKAYAMPEHNVRFGVRH